MQVCQSAQKHINQYAPVLLVTENYKWSDKNRVGCSIIKFISTLFMSSRKRGSDSVSSEISSTCIQLKESLTQIIPLLKKSGTTQTQQIHNLLKNCAIHLVELKSSNRELYLEAETKKSETQTEKQKLDQLNQQLQNLLYQKNNLKREILRCRDYK